MKGKTTTIDHGKCIQCSRCVNICPMNRLNLIEGQIRVIPDRADSCIQCCHCMSVCSTQAIRIGDFDYHDFEDLPDELPTLDDFLVLLKARRSVRQYQEKPVPHEIIEKIIDAATTAPMGLPPSSVEISVFDERKKILGIIPDILKELKSWDTMFSNKFLTPFWRMTMGAHLVNSMQNEIIPFARKIVAEAENGNDILTHGAPAMLLFHSTKYADSYKENILIAMTYAMIAAEGLGLGSCIIGMIPPAVERDKKLRESLEIPKDNEITGCLIFGYSRVTYNRSIPRKFKNVRWV